MTESDKESSKHKVGHLVQIGFLLCECIATRELICPTITGTYYSTPSGVTAYKTSSYNITEAHSKLIMRKAFTVNNFATFVTGGGGGTRNSRKNGANVNLNVVQPN